MVVNRERHAGGFMMKGGIDFMESLTPDQELQIKIENARQMRHSELSQASCFLRKDLPEEAHRNLLTALKWHERLCELLKDESQGGS